MTTAAMDWERWEKSNNQPSMTKKLTINLWKTNKATIKSFSSGEDDAETKTKNEQSTTWRTMETKWKTKKSTINLWTIKKQQWKIKNKKQSTSKQQPYQKLTSGQSKNNNEKSKTKNNQPPNNNLTKMKSGHRHSRHPGKGDNARTAAVASFACILNNNKTQAWCACKRGRHLWCRTLGIGPYRVENSVPWFFSMTVMLMCTWYQMVPGTW